MTSTVERRNTIATYPPNGAHDQLIPPMPPDLLTPQLRPNAVEVMNRRIVKRDDDGNPIETPAECFWRVAWTVAGGSQPYNGREDLARKYYKLMASGIFMPNSPCLVNAGRPLGQLSACFVLPVDDSISSIYGAVREAALIHQSGGGTGFSFSRIRAKGSPVRSTSGVASGPVSFMQVFDKGTWAIKQGSTRRGANMGILHIDHPDIMEFISLKGELDPITGTTPLENFNVSVAVTNDFMIKLDTILSGESTDIMWKESGSTVLQIWNTICENAWRTGDPGVIFIDAMNFGRSNPVPSLGPIEATNPCGEQPLYPYDSCNLGSINLAPFARPNSESEIDFVRLRRAVTLAVQFLDDVITVNRYPLEEIHKTTENLRRIGLGVMGWADLLIKLGYEYDSSGAYGLAHNVAREIQEAADKASLNLAISRGVFPLWKDSIYNGTDGELNKFRNSTRTTIAPTGTISVIAGCSSGIEPIYAPVFQRQHHIDLTDPDAWYQMYEIHPEFESELIREFDGDAQRISDILANLSADDTITSLIERGTLPPHFKIFRSAHEIDPADHVLMQSIWQKYTDNAVSKTINMPEHATPDDISRVYRDAYDRKCKGITIYRNNSRAVQVLSAPSKPVSADSADSVGNADNDAPIATSPFILVDHPSSHMPSREKLSAERPAIVHKFQIADQDGYLIVGMYPDGRPAEIFIKMSKQGSAVNGMMDTIAMLTSFCFQYGVPLETLSSKLRNVRFEPEGPTNNRSIPLTTSVVDYVFRWLDTKFNDPVHPATDIDNSYDDDGETLTTPQQSVSVGVLCPDCGGQMIFSEGCNKCWACGYERC